MSPSTYRLYKVCFGSSLAILACAMLAGTFNALSKDRRLPGPGYNLEDYVDAIYDSHNLERGMQQEELKYLLDDMDERLAHLSVGSKLLDRYEAYDLAAQQFRQAIELDESDILAHLRLSHALLLAGDQETARDELTRATQLFREEGSAGSISLRDDQALALQTLDSLGETYFDQLQDFVQAGSAYDLARQIQPERALFAVRYALALAVQGETDEAAHWFEEGDRLAGEDAPSRRETALFLLRHNRPDEAFSHVETLVRLQPQDIELVMQMAILLEMRGDKQGAIDKFRSALALGPDPQTAQSVREAIVRLSSQTDTSVSDSLQAAP